MIRTQLFSSDPDVIDRRVGARISLSELFAIGFSISMIGVFIWLQSQDLYQPFDYDNYINTVSGNYQIYFYANWGVPFYYLFSWMPHPIGFFIWNVLNVICVFYAARVFGGKPAFVLLSYQFLYVLFYGQLTGMIVGCLAFFWWSITHKRWNLAGAGLILAATKFQVGILIGGALWLYAEIAWRERIQILRIPIIVFLLSLLLYPGWIGQLYNRLMTNPPNDFASISLWRWIGPYSFLLLVLPLILPIKRESRMIAFIAASTLSLPYFQQADLISLFIFPISFIPLLGYIGALFSVFEWAALQSLFIVPLLTLIILCLPALTLRKLQANEISSKKSNL